MPNREKTFADTFSDLIASSGKSYEELAKALGISKTTVSYYANNRRKPKGDALERIAKYFGISTDELLGVKRTHSTGDELRKDRRSVRVETDQRGFVDLLDSKEIFPLVDILDKFSAAVVAESVEILAKREPEKGKSFLDGYEDGPADAFCEVMEDDSARVHEYVWFNMRLSNPETEADKVMSRCFCTETASQALENKAVDIFRMLLSDIRKRYLLVLKEETTETTAF